MEDDRIKTLQRDIELLRSDLAHVFPEHEHHYHQLKHLIREKEQELQTLQPPSPPEEKHWWEKLLKR